MLQYWEVPNSPKAKEDTKKYVSQLILIKKHLNRACSKSVHKTDTIRDFDAGNRFYTFL
jgi:hypothetical protein